MNNSWEEYKAKQAERLEKIFAKYPQAEDEYTAVQNIDDHRQYTRELQEWYSKYPL